MARPTSWKTPSAGAPEASNQDPRPVDATVDLARDRALVERCQAGDWRAFDELYRRYRHRLVLFCLRRLGERHEAEDAAQEAFAKAWRALPGFSGARRFYPWLTVIAANVCTDVLRRRARLLPVEEIPVGRLDRSGEPARDVDHALMDGVDTATALLALEQLSPRHRRVLSLREGSGWSTKAIADSEGVPVPVMETVLWRARKALQRQFAALSDTSKRLGMALLVIGAALRRALWRTARKVAHPLGRATRKVAHPLPWRAAGEWACQSGAWRPLVGVPAVAALGGAMVTSGLLIAGTGRAPFPSPGASRPAAHQVGASGGLPPVSAPGPGAPGGPAGTQALHPGTSATAQPTTAPRPGAGTRAQSPSSPVGAATTARSPSPPGPSGAGEPGASSGPLQAVGGAVSTLSGGVAQGAGGVAGAGVGQVTGTAGGVVSGAGSLVGSVGSTVSGAGSALGQGVGGATGAVSGAGGAVGSSVSGLGSATTPVGGVVGGLSSTAAPLIGQP